MGLYKKLDLWSIIDGLDKMTDYDYNGNEKTASTGTSTATRYGN